MINRRKRFVCGLSAAVVLLSLCGAAQAAKDMYVDPRFDNRFDPSLVEQWKETADVPLPVYPRDTDLVAVPLKPADTLTLFVDTRSVSFADDRVLRLTLVVESSSGARSVFFDGFRCATREYKTYAIGSPDGKFVPVKNAKWLNFPPTARNAFRYDVANDLICDDVSSNRSPQEFLQRLRHGP